MAWFTVIAGSTNWEEHANGAEKVVVNGMYVVGTAAMFASQDSITSSAETKRSEEDLQKQRDEENSKRGRQP